MAERLNWIIFEWRFAHIVIALLVALTMTLGFWSVDAFTSSFHPWYFDSRQEFLGMLIMFILMPAYLAICLIASMRGSLDLAQTLDSTNNTQLVPIVKSFPPGQSLFFGFLGFMYAVLFNIPGYGLDFFEGNRIEQAAILAQLLIWTLMGIFLPLRFRVSQAFNRAGDQVNIDIFEPSNLSPFARNGLIDVLIISGALVLSTLQSLDLSFRLDNYSKGLLVALPSILILAINPMWRLHRRMKTIRQEQLDELNIRIRTSSKAIDVHHLNELEVLLQRRERVSQAPVWPVDIKIIQRFLFYIVIPPLAWVGAALVELVIDGFVAS